MPHRLGELRGKMGVFEKVEGLWQESLKVAQLLGPKSPQVADSLNNLAVFYKQSGDLKKAERYQKESLAIKKEALPLNHHAYAESVANLGDVYYEMGNFKKAFPLIQQGVELRRSVLGPEHPDYATSVHALAALHAKWSDCAKAEPLYRECIDIRAMKLGKRHPEYAQALHRLAGALHQTDRSREALALLSEGCEVNYQVQSTSMLVLPSRDRLAFVKEMMGALLLLISVALSLHNSLSPEETARVFQCVALQKGLVYDSQVAEVEGTGTDPALQDVSGSGCWTAPCWNPGLFAAASHSPS